MAGKSKSSSSSQSGTVSLHRNPSEPQKAKVPDSPPDVATLPDFLKAENPASQAQQENAQPNTEESQPAQASNTQLHKADKKLLNNTLITRFNLSELKDLFFNIGIDHEIIDYTNKNDLTRELTKYCQRHDLIQTLLTEMMITRPDLQPSLVPMSQKYLTEPHTKAQLYIADAIDVDIKHITQNLAELLNIEPEAIKILAAATGSLKLLIDLPAEAVQKLIEIYQNNPEKLQELGFPIEIELFENLTPSHQERWREIYKDHPPQTHLKPTTHW